MSSEEQDERLENEIALLQAMYPDHVSYSTKNRELTYKESTEASFTLRLPAEYLTSSLPTVLSSTIAKRDTRQLLKSRVEELSSGEEVLDSIIATFEELVADHGLEAASTPERSSSSEATTTKEKKATIVVWLHHLLNTNKRKQALSPAASVSGITKPGYPGVLIYSGPGDAVHEHVNELKGLNWAAFQVRLESDDEWLFAHGKGVKEVEGLGDVVKEVGEGRKGDFMEAMRMK